MRTPRVLLSDYKSSDISGGFPALFKRAGCRVELYCGRGSWLRKGARADAWHRADIRTAERYVAGLYALVKEREYDWVVLLDESALQAVVDHLPDDTVSRKILPLGSNGRRAMIASKVGFVLIGQETGVPIPPSRIAGTPEEALREARAIGFPVILKTDRGGGGWGVRVCKDEAALEAESRDLLRKGDGDLVVQKYLPGSDFSIEALYRDGALIAYAPSETLALMAGSPSLTTHRRYQDDASIERLALKAGEAYGFHGFVNMTLRRYPDGDFLFEADARPNVWFEFGRLTGVDFSEGVRRFLAGVAGEPLRAVGTTELRHFYRDLRSALVLGDYQAAAAWLLNKDGRWHLVPRGRLLFATLRNIPYPAAEAWLRRHPRLRAVKRWLLRNDAHGGSR